MNVNHLYELTTFMDLKIFYNIINFFFNFVNLLAITLKYQENNLCKELFTEVFAYIQYENTYTFQV